MLRKSLLLLALVVALPNASLGGIGYNPIYYPGLVTGYESNFLGYNPGAGYLGCQYWCRSPHYRQYYCCSHLGANGLFGGGSFGGGLGGFGGGVGGFGGGYGR